jgi:hypothetical protein
MDIQNMSLSSIVSSTSVEDAKKKLNEVQQSAKVVEQALINSFNPMLNTYNIEKFN